MEPEETACLAAQDPKRLALLQVLASLHLVVVPSVQVGVEWGQEGLVASVSKVLHLRLDLVVPLHLEDPLGALEANQTLEEVQVLDQGQLFLIHWVKVHLVPVPLVVLCLEQHQHHPWTMLQGDLEDLLPRIHPVLEDLHPVPRGQDLVVGVGVALDLAMPLGEVEDLEALEEPVAPILRLAVVHSLSTENEAKVRPNRSSQVACMMKYLSETG